MPLGHKTNNNTLQAKAVEAASSAMQTDDSTGQGKPSFSESSTPEVEFFAYLLVIMYLADKKAFVEVGRSDLQVPD